MSDTFAFLGAASASSAGTAPPVVETPTAGAYRPVADETRLNVGRPQHLSRFPFMALNGHLNALSRCPLSGVKRAYGAQGRTSACNPFGSRAQVPAPIGTPLRLRAPRCGLGWRSLPSRWTSNIGSHQRSHRSRSNYACQVLVITKLSSSDTAVSSVTPSTSATSPDRRSSAAAYSWLSL